MSSYIGETGRFGTRLHGLSWVKNNVSLHKLALQHLNRETNISALSDHQLHANHVSVTGRESELSARWLKTTYICKEELDCELPTHPCVRLFSQHNCYFANNWKNWYFLLSKVIKVKIKSNKTNFYRAMHFSAKRSIAIACRLSVRLSVCNVGELWSVICYSKS